MNESLKLCRYFGDPAIGLKSVADCCFRLSNPSSFNDPFDCDGRADGETGINPKYIVGEKSYEQMKMSPMGLVRICELRSLTKAQWNSQTFIDGLAKIMCFTCEESPVLSHMLFWSHYANSGRGVRVHFSLPRQIPDVYEIRKVKYANVLPRCNLEKISMMGRDPEAMTFCDSRIWTKGEAWAYENEFRLRMFLTANDPRFVKTDNLTRDMFLRVKPAWITGVDLGPCSELGLWKPFVKELMSDKAFAHIQFRHALKDPDCYEYRYEEI